MDVLSVYDKIKLKGIKMKKSLIVYLVLSVMSFAYGYSKNDLLLDYQNGQYQKVCSVWSELIVAQERDENIFTAVGDACAREDSINSLCNVIKYLVSTKEHRESGSYFATLVLQKKLIYQFMLDGISLKELKLPRTDHLLSKVFEQLSAQNYVIDEDKNVIIQTPEIIYAIWLDESKPRKMYIDEMKDNKLVKRHWFL